MEFEEEKRIESRIEAVYMDMNASNEHVTEFDHPIAMEIGNLEQYVQEPRRTFTDKKRKYLGTTFRFKCHKQGCRPWKHKMDSI